LITERRRGGSCVERKNGNVIHIHTTTTKMLLCVACSGWLPLQRQRNKRSKISLSLSLIESLFLLLTHNNNYSRVRSTYCSYSLTQPAHTTLLYPYEIRALSPSFALSHTTRTHNIAPMRDTSSLPKAALLSLLVQSRPMWCRWYTVL
jgi:hypothetical protein